MLVSCRIFCWNVTWKWLTQSLDTHKNLKEFPWPSTYVNCQEQCVFLKVILLRIVMLLKIHDKKWKFPVIKIHVVSLAPTGLEPSLSYTVPLNGSWTLLPLCQAGWLVISVQYMWWINFTVPCFSFVDTKYQISSIENALISYKWH